MVKGTDQVMEKTVSLGPEWDDMLRSKLKRALESLGADTIDHSWGMGDSQEVEMLAVIVDGRQLHVEAETYVGLTLSGPTDLVERVAEMISNADEGSELSTGR